VLADDLSEIAPPVLAIQRRKRVLTKTEARQGRAETSENRSVPDRGRPGRG